MVDGVAHAVDERIEQIFDDGLVELGFLTLDDRSDLFVEGLRKVAHQPRKRLKIWAIGTMRMRSTPSCSSLMMRPRFCEVPRNTPTVDFSRDSTGSNAVKSLANSSLICFFRSLTDRPSAPLRHTAGTDRTARGALSL